MGEITTFDQIILIPICSLLFLIVVGLITHIFKMQAKRTDEKYQETDDKIELLEKAGKQRDETLLAIQEFGRELKENLVVLNTLIIPPTFEKNNSESKEPKK